ncbi:type II secretion system protein [Candidatus Dojkabacteria bacterium]|uniref:Type II secretion system protein n=1 Tax=Candidatus Dojkabacteria bacterium TaxID=2099670 RepID=A0A955L8U0_9BACT|nr:type II secretion system protein [Candidatus Dojkabacteria bacterium]
MQQVSPSTKNKKNAFSSLELLIVIAIFAVIASLGLTAVRSFRIGTELSSSAQQFEGVVRETINKARNNVVSRTEQVAPDSITDIFASQTSGFLLIVDENLDPVVQLYSCKEASPVSYDCSNPEPVLLNFVDDIEISATLNGSVTCYGVLIENLTGDIQLVTKDVSGRLNAISLITDIDSNPFPNCTVEISHALRTNQDITFNFNRNDNTFERQ